MSYYRPLVFQKEKKSFLVFICSYDLNRSWKKDAMHTARKRARWHVVATGILFRFTRGKANKPRAFPMIHGASPLKLVQLTLQLYVLIRLWIRYLTVIHATCSPHNSSRSAILRSHLASILHLFSGLQVWKHGLRIPIGALCSICSFGRQGLDQGGVVYFWLSVIYSVTPMVYSWCTRSSPK